MVAPNCDHCTGFSAPPAAAIARVSMEKLAGSTCTLNWFAAKLVRMLARALSLPAPIVAASADCA
jgi:hypothetical protein